MDNQHKKIKGYRDLSQEEIDLMNRIKDAGQVLLELQAELAARIALDHSRKEEAYYAAPENSANNDIAEFLRFKAAEPARWAAIGKSDIQTGVMALVRAVAQPTNC